jgi:ketosteroid isomerase-like protein
MVSPTSTSAVAATVAKFIGTISSRNYDKLPGFLAPDAVWWTAGNPALPGDDGGAEPALDHVDLLRGGGNRYDEYSFTILSQVTEHSKSVIEGRVVGKGPLDLVYVNNVTMHFTLDAHNKIQLVHEYIDRIQVNWLIQWLQDHNITSPH